MSALPLLDPELAAPTTVDRATSRRLAQALQAKDRGCYRNALRALPLQPSATYVEGVVVLAGGLQLEHAWLEAADRVVDPTPVYSAMPEGDCTYFAGPRWTLAEIHALFASGQDDILTPVLPFDRVDSPQRRAWIAATLAAFRHVSALHLRRTGQPAIPRADDTTTLEGLIGWYWAKQVLERHTGPSHSTGTIPPAGQDETLDRALPRWTPQIRPLIDTAKPATTPLR